ncbi:hypothetical protein B0J17DRAFT_630888 [Rhizoctonia solani]|nr:hypothetical protein B0J17DRAFT_630888 [Rhizoctonia solani]
MTKFLQHRTTNGCNVIPTDWDKAGRRLPYTVDFNYCILGLTLEPSTASGAHARNPHLSHSEITLDLWSTSPAPEQKISIKQAAHPVINFNKGFQSFLQAEIPQAQRSLVNPYPAPRCANEIPRRLEVLYHLPEISLPGSSSSLWMIVYLESWSEQSNPRIWVKIKPTSVQPEYGAPNQASGTENIYLTRLVRLKYVNRVVCSHVGEDIG